MNSDKLHLQTTDTQKQCIVEGCKYWGEAKHGHKKPIIYYTLCKNHRRLSRARYLGNVPENWVPALKRHIYPDHPKCQIFGCNDYCLAGQMKCGKRHYRRFCPHHYTISTGRISLNAKKREMVDYSLPMPSPFLPKQKKQKLELECIVKGCHSCRKRNRKSKSSPHYTRCPHHYKLYHLGLPSDYVFPLAKSYVRSTCVVEGCNKPQANKGFINNKRAYSKYCEFHRKRQFKTIKIAEKIDKNKCSICGWEGSCDRHRIKTAKDGGGYKKDNIQIVCPNCHRLINRGIDPRTRLRKKTVLGG